MTTRIYIVEVSKSPRHYNVGVFMDSREARMLAFKEAWSHGPDAEVSVCEYVSVGPRMIEASTWAAPSPPVKPRLSDRHLNVQKEHEIALEEHERELLDYEAAAREYEGYVFGGRKIPK